MSQIEILKPNAVDFGLTRFSAENVDLSRISGLELIKLLTSPISNCIVLLYDIRDYDSYMDSRIKTSRLMNCSKKLMMKKSMLEMKRKVEQVRNENAVIIIYDYTDNLNHELGKFLQELSKSIKLYLLEGGFSKFKTLPTANEFLEIKPLERLPISPTNPEFDSEDILGHPLSKIFDFIFIGNQDDSENMELLLSYGITDILCLNKRSTTNYGSDSPFNYKKISANDRFDQDLLQFFKETNQFIDEARKRGGKILVHCHAGVSRSVTIVMAYILTNNTDLSVLDALQIVKESRPIACPNFNFLGQLDRYKRSLNT